MKKGKIKLVVPSAKSDAAYVYLPDHPGPGNVGVVTTQLRLRDVCPNYTGPDLYFDFDKGRRLIGIDIML